MTLRTFNKMLVVTDNLVNPTDVTSVVDTGITAFVPGFPLSNLKYQGPWTMMKTDGVVGDPTIEFNFGSDVGPTVLGIINHNLGRDNDNPIKYGSIDIEHWDGVSAYVSIGNVLINGNRDILIVWNAAVPRDQWRITINAVAASHDFFIGSMFWGTGTREMLTNPINGGLVQTRVIPVITEESSGGAKHVSFGAKKRSGTAELTVRRGDRDDLGYWANINEDELIGILGPEMSDYMQGSFTPVGDGIFWGYLVDNTFAAHGPGQSTSSQTAVYDYSLFFDGAY